MQTKWSNCSRNLDPEAQAALEGLTLEASAPAQVVSDLADLVEAPGTSALDQMGTLVPVLMEISAPALRTSVASDLEVQAALEDLISEASAPALATAPALAQT